MSEDADGANEGGGSPGRQGKVARLLETYEMEEVGDELAEAWVGESGDRKSLRELAEYLNKRLIEQMLEQAGEEQPFPGEVDTIYAAVTDDETSRGLEQEVRGRLERAGVDFETLSGDLVSYQAVRTYLTSDRGIEYAREERDPIDSTRTQIQRLIGRLRAVSEQRIDDLESSGELTLGSYNLLVNLQLYCEDCGRQYSVEEVLENGGCDCLLDGGR